MRLMQVITTMCCIQIVHEIPNGCTRIGRKYQKMSTLCEHSTFRNHRICNKGNKSTNPENSSRKPQIAWDLRTSNQMSKKCDIKYSMLFLQV